jgi:hypothetical protein
MTPKEFIEKRLSDLKSTEKAGGILKSDKELTDFIFQTIMSKKFRKFSVNSETKDKIRTAIELNIKKNEPIKIAIPFGSYKLWRFEESPEVDWAELFSMIYYARWLKPIIDSYKPGVWFDFCGDDAILELMNNIPPEDTEKYKKSFRALINFIQPYLPNNFKYTFNPVGERYSSKEEFLTDLNGKVEELKKKELTPLTEHQIEMMKFNIKSKAGEEVDFEKNRLLHDAYMAVSKRRPYHKAADKILICSTPFGGTSLPIGTTKTSVVKFQTGVGVLRKTENGFIEYIYSPSQLESNHFIKEEISIKGLDSKNFKTIRIIA